MHVADDPARLYPCLGEPLALRTSEAPGDGPAAGLRCVHLEFSSRGDRVPARIWLPAGKARPPLVSLLIARAPAPGATGTVLEAAARWVHSGAALALCDLPLLGDRHSPKLSERLIQALTSTGAASPEDRWLAADFARQAVLDQRRLLEAVAAWGGAKEGPCAVVGLGLGADVAALACAADGRFGLCGLLLPSAAATTGPLDVKAALTHIPPRPLLLVHGEEDARSPRAQELRDAAGPHATCEWLAAGADDRERRALVRAWELLEGQLGPMR